MSESEAVATRLEAACRQVGLDSGMAQKLTAQVLEPEILRVRGECEQIRAERDQMADVRREVMKLLNVQAPNRILHDLRNLLNELNLLRSLADLGDEGGTESKP